jgi:hypothetical protein
MVVVRLMNACGWVKGKKECLGAIFVFLKHQINECLWLGGTFVLLTYQKNYFYIIFF